MCYVKNDLPLLVLNLSTQLFPLRRGSQGSMQKTVAVLGGGIGGLSACYHLSKSPQVSKVHLSHTVSHCHAFVLFCFNVTLTLRCVYLILLLLFCYNISRSCSLHSFLSVSLPVGRGARGQWALWGLAELHTQRRWGGV